MGLVQRVDSSIVNQVVLVVPTTYPMNRDLSTGKNFFWATSAWQLFK